MVDFTYNQIIEYMDGTRDLNFEEAQKWARENGTTFEEDVAARVASGNGVLKRYFIIGPEPKEPEPEPERELTQGEKEAEVRAVRNSYLYSTDMFMIVDFPITDEQREEYKAYRQYLRDYPETENWYESNPQAYEEWKEDLNATEQITTMGDVYGTNTSV